MTTHLLRKGLGDAPARVLRRMLRRPARMMRRELLPRIVPPASGFVGAPRPHALVVGLLSSASGIGKSARLCIETLGRAGYGISTGNVARLFACDDGIAYPGSTRDAFEPRGFAIYHLNPPMLLPGVIRAGLSRYYQAYTVGYWAWELEELPPEWIRCIRHVHAIIVPSRFCQEAVRRHTQKPVLVVPHPVAESAAGGAASPPVRTPGMFRIVNVFRFGSSFERKNPVALVRAFHRAFGSGPGAELVVKASDGHRFPAEMARLRAAIGARGNVRLIDEVWPEDEVAALMRSADAYASLHRSEGFGLPLAEAMMAGVPVIATDWSGNTDFCSPEHSFPVACTLVPFRDSHGDYEQVCSARWAEPSVEHAAEQMRRVRDDLPAARAKAEAARCALRRHIAAHDYAGALGSLAGEAAAGSRPALPHRRPEVSCP